jgi:glutamyl-tRNA reductase
VVGTDHQRAAVEMRERLAFDPARLRAALVDLAGHCREGLILSTCNRTEIYAVVEPAGETAPEGAVFAFLATHCRATADELARATTVRSGEHATHHLFRVACGLESLVLGEPQILGQLRDALAAARSAGSAGPLLTRLATEALRAGKRARSDTEIVRNRLTIPHAALALAGEQVDGLRGKDALVIGAGEMGGLTAKLLRSAGVRSLTIANRSVERAERLANAAGATAICLDEVPTVLSRVDVVFGAAGAESYLVTPKSLEGSAVRRERLVLVDMAVPRTFDPALADRANVALFDVDDLATPAAALHADYQAEVERVEAMVADAVDGFTAWSMGRAAAPTIAALRTAAEEVRQAELNRALARLGHLSERDREVVAALSAGLVNKLLHRPMTTLQAGAGREDDYIAATQALFGLADDLNGAGAA